MSEQARELWRSLGERGVLRALFAEGPSREQLGGLLAELDREHPVGVVLSACVQLATILPILRGETGAAAKVYESALSGAAVLALAATDAAAAGSDLTSLGTKAELAEDHLVLTGAKRWITNACTADHVLVLARHRPADHFTSFLWVLVPVTAPGVRVEPASGGLFAGSGVGHLEFDQVRLDREHVVGGVGRGMVSFGRHVTTERLAGGLWAAAMCRRVLADTLKSLCERQLGGRPMWTNEAIRHRFARCLVETRRIEAMCAQVEQWSLLGSMVLKVSVAESLDLVLTECAQLAGAEAFAEGGLAQLRAEIGMFGIAGGASGAMLAGIAEHAHDLLGLRAG
ncbi:acyl-CoA dehydrogenase family protein [Kutzneria albida]|uniref:Acyl-CoA dehydrogenase n=1 Tax=Kutzneria albida DSM 43870 TaxID=1449976 RepID=W5WEG4_9PSEU|nr:acyl-CoA dehydrogenase family protein [Kutzneria albida]AHH99583.1 hypothetical protein KALB_6223 [Kutzneria albida DSM 43870]